MKIDYIYVVNFNISLVMKNFLRISKILILLVFAIGLVSCNEQVRANKEMAKMAKQELKDEKILIEEFLNQQYDLVFYEESALLLATERANNPDITNFAKTQLAQLAKKKELLKYYKSKYHIQNDLNHFENTKSDLYKISVVSQKDFDKMFLKLYSDFITSKNQALESYNDDINKTDINEWNEVVMHQNRIVLKQTDSIFNNL